MRQVNRRECAKLTTEVHAGAIGIGDPTMQRLVEGYLPLWTKERKPGLWASKGKAGGVQ